MTWRNANRVLRGRFSKARCGPFVAVTPLKQETQLLQCHWTKFTLPILSCSHLADLAENVSVKKVINFFENEKNNSQAFLLELFDKKKKVESELEKLKEIDSEQSKEMKALIEEEKKLFIDSLNEIQLEILNSLKDKDNECSHNNNETNVEIQIIPAVGGTEARLFADELFNMYMNYINYKGWDLLLAEQKDSGAGAVILLSGDSSFQTFECEGGVHRVQRVPMTETKGRTHTSTCSVFVYKKEDCNDIHIPENDLVYEAMRSSGPGGQNVNKVETCIRLKHLPSGISVVCQDSRYQFDNRKFALQKLKMKLLEIEKGKISSKKQTLKKEQTGTNDYSDKIRTYNYPQNRVTDHRINYTMHNLEGFMTGTKELDILNLKLQKFGEREKIMKFVEKTLQSDGYKNFEKKMSGKT